jgi:hypothetical protein
MRPTAIVSIGIAAALSAGCSGGSLIASNARSATYSVHKTRGSWIRPDARKQWLLYVSDETNDTVDIYNFRAKNGELSGQITGFDHPLGECVDSAGNVYVANFRGNDILEFAHAGTTPIATAFDYYGRPVGCAVDPTTGNIAVSNTVTVSAPGNILIFSGGLGGSQTVISGSNISLDSFDPPAYDSGGNLFLEGSTYSAQPVFAELPVGSGTLELLNGLTIGQPAGVQWDGSYIAAADQNYENSGVSAIYRVTVSGSAVTVVRTTVLTDTCSSGDYISLFQPFIGGTTRKRNTVVAGNLAVECSYRLDFWNYADGGNPKRVMPPNIAPEEAAGATLSPPGAAVEPRK